MGCDRISDSVNVPYIISSSYFFIISKYVSKRHCRCNRFSATPDSMINGIDREARQSLTV